MLLLFYCDHFNLPLPPNHRFPMEKYRRLRQAVIESKITPLRNIKEAPAATVEQLRRVHTDDYIRKVMNGTLTKPEIRRIGFPWSVQLVERSLRSTGGTIAAASAAMRNGISANLAGGTHHAHVDWGQGFCIFNDAVVAARNLQADGQTSQVLLIDCDVHQGNGSASATEDDRTVYTFSIHGQKNFPFRKARSDLDIELPDGTGDSAYLQALRTGLDVALAASQPQLAIFLAGADPFAGDRLGRLALSKQGLAQRDRLVLASCRERGIPVAIVMAGGYAPVIQDVVDIHLQTLRIAAEFVSA